MAIWHPESGITYSQYLQANSFVRDITGQVKTSGIAIQGEISENTKQLVANNQELARTFAEGFNSIDSTLEWGFNRIEYVLEDVNASIQSLHADFNYSMGLLLEEVHTHNTLLSSLLNKLDAIHKILESPTLTQAREFYHIGCERLSKGLLDKALEALTEAEKKNDTDFFTQFHIGKLYLYGIDDDDNVLDLEKAKQHLLHAARYAKAEISVDPSFAKLAAEALLQASIALYAQLGEKHIFGNKVKTNTLLEEARKLTSEAIKLYPQFSEAHYHVSKYCALLDDHSNSIIHLNKAIILDRNYAVKVDLDHAFDSVRSSVVGLLAERRIRTGIVSALTIHIAKKLLELFAEWHPEESRTLKIPFDKCKQDFLSAQNHYSSNTYFGFLDAMIAAEAVISSAPLLKSKRIDELKLQVRNLFEDAKSKLPATGKYTEEVEEGIHQTNLLISKAEHELTQPTYESYKSAIRIAEAANIKSSFARNKSFEEDGAAALRVKRAKWSREYAAIGAKTLGIIGGLGGCASCLGKGDFNLFSGAIIGAIVGAIFGAIIGQMKNE